MLAREAGGATRAAPWPHVIQQARRDRLAVRSPEGRSLVARTGHQLASVRHQACDGLHEGTATPAVSRPWGGGRPSEALTTPRCSSTVCRRRPDPGVSSLLAMSFSTPRMTPSRHRTPTAVLRRGQGVTYCRTVLLPTRHSHNAPAVFNRLVGVVHLVELAVGAVGVDRLVVLRGRRGAGGCRDTTMARRTAAGRLHHIYGPLRRSTPSLQPAGSRERRSRPNEPPPQLSKMRPNRAANKPILPGGDDGGDRGLWRRQGAPFFRGRRLAAVHCAFGGGRPAPAGVWPDR